MPEPIISIANLTRRFGSKTALDGVTLEVPRGGVYGLVGANGAGKTTLIRHVLGLLRAEHGTVRVFGLDPVADPVGVLSRIGYLSEENDLPGWMRVDELITYSRVFYPKWDDAYAEELRRTFALDADAKVKTLSKGNKARLGLLVALAYRPELLVLGEPSSGLDPVVRRDILEAVIRTLPERVRPPQPRLCFPSHRSRPPVHRRSTSRPRPWPPVAEPFEALTSCVLDGPRPFENPGSVTRRRRGVRRHRTAPAAGRGAGRAGTGARPR